MAGRASLAYLGQEDVVLSTLPEVTYFVQKYTGTTQFAYRVDEVQFQADQAFFGSESYSVIPRSGDIVTNLYLKVNPPLPVSTEVLSSAGTLMIKYIDLYIGTQAVERLWGEYIEMKMDLEVPETKQTALQSLTGKNSTLSLATYTVPIPFSCIQRGLPICAFEEDVTIRVVWYPSSTFLPGAPSLNSPIVTNLLVEYTYLSQGEVDSIKATPQTFIFEQAQRVEFFAPVGVNSVTCPLQFSNPVKEMFFVVQNSSAQGYDYSNVSGGSTDQLSNLALSFNTTERISPQVGTPILLRNVQALEFHTRIPDRLFYMYSFSLDPESPDPTGHVNMSMFPIQNLTLNLNTSTDNRNIMIYATSYNFLKIEKGHATILFPNSEY